MSSYLITRLPSHSKALDAIEFMQRNELWFRLSSNVIALEALMTTGALSVGLIGEEFQLGEQDQHMLQQLVGDSVAPQVKQEVQDDHLQLGMGISQASNNLDSYRQLMLKASLENVGSNGNLVNGRPATSVMSVHRDETILGGRAMDSNRIGHDEPIDSKDSVVVELSFAGNARGSVEFPGNSGLNGLNDNGMNAEDLMDDFDDEEDVEENKNKKTMEKKKINVKGRKTRALQKKKDGRPANSIKRLLFACPLKKCRSSYKNFENLKEHMKIHKNNEKDVFCDVCKKKFPSIDDGSEHIRKREKKECCGCGKKLQSLPSLRDHHRCHTKEKPYSCGLCKKRFSIKQALKRHEYLHLGKKPFACCHCNYKTNLNFSLKVHMRSHTGEKPYCCEKCDEKFKQLSGLQRHVKKYHKE